VDFFNFYNKEVVGAPRLGTPLTNGARDLWENESTVRRAYYDDVSASAELLAGDVLVYGEPHGRAIVNGKQIFFGHVAIYIGNSQVIEQNGRKGEVVSIDPLFKNGLLGVLRPRNFAAQTPPQNEPETPQNKNKHIIIAGDTFWGLEEQNGWEHGTLQALNPEMIATELQIGAEMVVPSTEKKRNQLMKPTTQSVEGILSGGSRTLGSSNTEPSNASTQTKTPEPSKSDSQSGEANCMQQHAADAVLQWFMVVIVLGATVYLAIINNEPEIIFNLTSLAFGYYFGSRGTSTIIAKK